MGMMVTARKIGEGPDEVRYEFGFDRAFDRVLIIDPRTAEARVEDGDFNSPASAITAKIVKAWRADGAFPPGMIFAS